MEPQYIINNNGEKTAVILPIKDFENMIRNLEEIEDIKLYDSVKTLNEAPIPFEEYVNSRKK